MTAEERAAVVTTPEERAEVPVTPEERALSKVDFGVKKSLRYHAHRRATFEKLDGWVNVLTALAGTTAFVAYAGKLSEQAVGAGSAAVAVMGIVAVVVGFGRHAREHQDLYRKFSDLAIEIASIEHPSGQDIARMRAKRLTIEAEEPHVIDALERLCWNEEAEARGATPDQLQKLTRWQRLRARLA